MEDEKTEKRDELEEQDDESSPLLARLREVTEEARRKAEEERAARKRAEEARAKQIISTIEERAIEQAQLGKNHLIVMDVSYDKFPTFIGLDGWTIKPEFLTGPGRIVYDHCEAQGLNPELVGRWSSLKDNIHRIDFSIVVHW